jgi:cyclase
MIRLIGVLLWKNQTIVQSEKFVHTNVIHSDALHAVESFRSDDLDELIVINVSEDSSSFESFILDLNRITSKVRIPVAAGGHIRTEGQAQMLLDNGADKLVINSLILLDEDLVRTLSSLYGASTLVASVDIKKDDYNSHKYVYIERGKIKTEVTLEEWLSKVQRMGIGEVFFNSIDHDGSRNGYDLESLRFLAKNTNLPIIGFGGVSEWNHLTQGILAGCSAVAFANTLYYVEFAPRKAKKYLMESGVDIRIWG